MTPETLLEIGSLPWFSPTADRESHFRDVKRRDTFACEPHGRADRETGNQRFSCPATAKKVRCPLKPDSMCQPPSMRTIAPTAELTAAPPPICSQHTAMMPGTAQANLRQKYPHGSPEWYDAYSRRTPNVESFFGNLRDESAQHRGRIRVMGRAKNSWMLAWWIAAVNLRLISAFTDETKRRPSDPARVLSRRKPRRNRAVPFVDRKKKRFAEASAGGSPP